MENVAVSSPDPGKAESKLAIQASRTRARLIETTLQLWVEQGLRRLTLDAVAARAGVTKGAIYGHFENRDALLMAAIFSRPQVRPDTINWPTGREGTVRERLRRLGKAVMAQQEQSAAAPTVGAEFLLYAMTHEALRAPVGEMLSGSQGGLEKNILGLFAPEELPMPVASFALLLGTLIPGLMFRRALMTTPLPEETILAAFEGLAGPAT